MSAKINIQEPVLDGGIRSVNYFTGRLLTANDLSREKLAHREADWRLGRALGDGVAYGLEVSIVEKGALSTNPAEAQKTPVLRIEPGLAVNRSGQTLALRDPIDLQLVKPTTPISAGASVFEECRPVQSGTYVAGKGVYLLTIMPAEGREGRAPATGLGSGAAPCNTDTILEAVKFRHIYLNPFLTNGELDDPNLLRNRVAYRCFGVKEMNDFLVNPFGLSITRYGLIDELRKEKVISNCDAPLAIFYWTTSGGVEFVDLWPARRRLTQRGTTFRDSLLVDDRRVGESMFLQFAQQIQDILSYEPYNAVTSVATERFDLLPPVGFIPLAGSKFAAGFDPLSFFQGLMVGKTFYIAATRLEDLIHKSFSYSPIDLSHKEELIHLYLVRENMEAFDLHQSNPPQPYLIFSSGHIPFIGEARFNLAHWNYSNFT
jgi:hypothetical protein